uniref:Solute carrier family 5 member 8 n=1 Tax=Salarias fasciatus TaxID=181472 RepID=A0A672FRC3_SALFA
MSPVQIGIMIAGYLAVMIKSLIKQGGFSTILADSQQGGRLNAWDFDLNPFRRHTFWTVVIGGTLGWVNVYGTNQAQVQRYAACRSVAQARIALFINLLGLWAILLSAMFAGLCIYSVYKRCDPWTAGLVSVPDELLPFLVKHTMAGEHGLLGLFFSAVYCGSLSTVSSSINALAAMTLEDLIKPYTAMSEKRLTALSKALSESFTLISLIWFLHIRGSHHHRLGDRRAAIGPVLSGNALSVCQHQSKNIPTLL